jgi:Domain of unknown function (DUF4338)
MQAETIFRYRGRVVTAADVEFIRDLIAKHPGVSRRGLSVKLCEALDWRQANGAFRDMVCRGLMLSLHRLGHIELPAVAKPRANPFLKRASPVLIDVDRSPIEGALGELPALTVRQVRRSAQERLFNSLMHQHHYLGYSQPVGEHLKFMVYAGERPVALFAWSSAPRHLGPRDRYLGWSQDQRKQNIRYVAYNTRYLILPWVKVPHLASHLLSRMTRMLSQEWQKVYGHPVYFAETFVDRSLHKGTCYRAANWVMMGLTSGRGKADQTKRANRTLKEVLGLALTADFRQKLGAA